MTAKELLQFQLDDAGFQLDQVLSGYPSANSTEKNETGMSPIEMLTHLCEAYVATVSHIRGEKHEWGSFTSDAATYEEALNQLRRLRTEAVAAVLGGDNEAMKAGHMYILAHDYYHIGQLCGARLACDPAWNAYSIYR